jgi:hypothetical protein
MPVTPARARFGRTAITTRVTARSSGMVDPQVRSLQRARGARSELLGLAEGLQVNSLAHYLLQLAGPLCRRS